MTSPGALLRRTFSAFSVHNFRLYFGGQVVSVSGTWMQRVAQSWLVLEPADSGCSIPGRRAITPGSISGGLYDRSPGLLRGSLIGTLWTS